MTQTATLKKDLAVILGIGFVITAIAVFFGLDEKLAILVHDQSNVWGWQARQYSQIPMIALSVLFLVFILIPPLRQKFPTVNHVALIWLFTLLFGAGLLVHTILKDTVERPRPHETVTLNGPAPFSHPFVINQIAEFKSKSFPSGHVAMAAMLLTPFFALRRRKPKLAKTILITGITYGALVGYGRMLLGAHFFTDVLWGILCVCIVGAIAGKVITEKTDFKSRYTALLIAFAVLCLAWFNTFTLTLHIQSPAKEISFNIPCEKINIQTTTANEPYKADVTISGAGGPTSWITPIIDNGNISYTTKLGIFHDLTCEASIWVPAGTKHTIPHLNGVNK
tara:strand:- start:181675 stop:182685 length:1011 start_codon:yes stop_codon:yes gene_type:complete